MRLLKYGEDGRITINSFEDDATPPYAILSHTWGPDEEEVKYADIVDGSSTAKAGYEKIRFCGEQARQDGLEYFWVDTCCIKKDNKAELSLAINSMFRWYRNSTQCYVYLSDVSSQTSRPNTSSDVCSLQACKPELQRSRWFTRGWTLQELLAPSKVEFFSCEWCSLGDKTRLKSEIHEATAIPYEALEGAPLFQFSVEERLRWRQYRHTSLKEDAAYSLCGIFDVDIAPVYGEGGEEAFKRLYEKIRKRDECLRSLRATDPRHDKKRIEETKGGLLVDSYRWVLSNTAFQQWRQDPHSRLLWVKGDAGKGKTMLLCGIINELQMAATHPVTVSYFFCQATEPRINTATAVLRGLLYMLVDQQPSLISHIGKKHDVAGESLFSDVNAWIALTEIWTAVLQDPGLRTTYLIIDALDECVSNRLGLLEFVAKQSSVSSRVKWIVSSRHWPEIEAQLKQAEDQVILSLELNANSVAAAVIVFIQQKVDQLAQEKQYKADLRHAVLQHLELNADNTFLWVALVCQELKKTANRHVLKKLAVFPPKLDELYNRMMQLMNETDDADACRCVLATTAIAYRPLTLPELVALIEKLEDLDDIEAVQEIIGHCGSFLTQREDTVYFVHQSAKDFLFSKASDNIFPNGTGIAHQDIFLKSLAVLSSTLCRDMYSLEAPGYPIEDVNVPETDPLAALRYPCDYWIDHLYESKALMSSVDGLKTADVVDEFLRKKYLYWLEGLSLCKSVGKGVVSMEKLRSLVQEMYGQDRLIQLVQDARRFIMYHKGAIEGYPLQTYASALLFSPTGSLIRQLFQHEEPGTISIRPAMSDGWSACLQTLENHSMVWSVAFSHDSDSARLALASDDRTVKIWDAHSGACLQTLENHSRVWSVAFSHDSDSARLASASDDRTVKIWDAHSGACLQTLKGHSSWVRSVAFSHDSDSARLASASDDRTVKIWDAHSGACLQTLKGHSSGVWSVAFSHDSARLASASGDRTVKIWDAHSSAYLQTLKGHSSTVWLVAFSHDLARLASVSNRTVKIWNTHSGACLQTLKGHSSGVWSVAFSYNSTWLASASTTVKIWDASSGVCLQTFKGHSSWVSMVAFTHDSTRLASASDDCTVKIWDASSGACLQTFNAGRLLRNLAFNSTDNCLYTEIGSIVINSSKTPSIAAITVPERSPFTGTSLSCDDIWIKSGGKNMLWVPSEYRPRCSSVYGTTVGLGVGSGKVWFCSIKSFPE